MPQVLAATAPVGAVAVQVGTLVKLVRVLMLGPVVLGPVVLGPVVLSLSLPTRRWRNKTDEMAPHVTAGERPALGGLPSRKLVPWFIGGFLGLAGLRSVGMIPSALLAPTASIANLLTVISMAALGLGTDLRVVARAGGRVTTAVTASLLILGAISLGLIRVLRLV